MVSTTKKQSEKFYTSAHLQSCGYKVLVEFYAQAASKLSKSLAQTFPQDFSEFSKFFQIPAKIVAPPNNELQENAGSYKGRFML